MPQYYGITRSDDYLAHYGIKGMRWGVRKAIATGNDYALDRHYIKAQKKLNKLIKRGLNKNKYIKRAAGLGAGAAALGATAIGGTGGIASAAQRLVSMAGVSKINRGKKLFDLANNGILKGTTEGDKLSKYGNALRVEGARQANKTSREVSNAINKWGSEKIRTPINDKDRSVINKLTKNQVLRAATGAGAIGLAGAAGYNAYRAATADKNIVRAAQFKSEMDRAFAGTKYANGRSTASKPAKRRHLFIGKNAMERAEQYLRDSGREKVYDGNRIKVYRKRRS